jgi:hypothetical protein
MNNGDNAMTTRKPSDLDFVAPEISGAPRPTPSRKPVSEESLERVTDILDTARMFADEIEEAYEQESPDLVTLARDAVADLECAEDVETEDDFDANTTNACLKFSKIADRLAKSNRKLANAARALAREALNS